MVKHFNKDDNFNELIKNDVLVDFYAEWCGPCQMLAPNLEKIDYDVLKVNVDEFQEIAIEYGVMSIPTLISFKNGEIDKQYTGYLDLEKIKEMIGK